MNEAGARSRSESSQVIHAARTRRKVWSRGCLDHTITQRLAGAALRSQGILERGRIAPQLMNRLAITGDHDRSARHFAGRLADHSSVGRFLEGHFTI